MNTNNNITEVEIMEDGISASYKLFGIPAMAEIQQDQEGDAYFIYYVYNAVPKVFYLNAITENN